jgi:YfiR/HmsC-like
VAAAVLCALLAAAVPAAAQPVQAYELQATFLYNFTKFVTWPDDAFDDSDVPFRICVVGGDPQLRDFLEKLVDGETVSNRPLAVSRHSRVRETGGCQIVYVPAEHDPGYLPSVLGSRHDAVLTVGEGEDFLSAGGILQFYRDDGKLRLRVNETERERLRLRMSSRLLQLCDRVRTSSPGNAGAGGE